MEELYHAALEVSGDERAALLAQSDPEVRRAVEALLAQGGSGEVVLDRPAWERATTLLDSPTAQIESGALLGPYRVESRIGAGGMGQVYRATDSRLNRSVAIKFLSAQFSDRFEREAKAIAALNHPNICQIYDIAYMSPEQLNGEAVDGRSDLFSLGVILYTILTGHRPFQGNSAITVSFKVVNCDPIPATLLNAELPQGLDYIITRAMAKDPAERYQRGAEMVLDIKQLREGRAPLSKAKLPGSLTGGSASQTANEKPESSLNQLGIAGKPRSSTRAPLPADGAAANLLEQIQKKSFAGILVVAGLFIFTLWIISVGPKEGPSGAAEPLPPAREVAPVKTAATPTAPVDTATSVATAPTPIVEKLSKPVPAGRIHPSPTKVGRASSPTVSPAVLPTVSPATSPATLEIEVEHKFAAANLSIWVDDRLAYTHGLEGTDKKHLVVFHHVQGHEFHAMQVSPGKHSLKVQVTSDGAAYDQSATVAGEFASGQENVLRISFDKHGEMSLSLK